jgi:chromosome segregation ATPase
MGDPNGFSNNLPPLVTNTMCEPTGNNPSQAALSGLDLLEIACQLRWQNQELLKILLRLEKALVDSQQQLQEQIRCLDAAEMACRQAQLNAAQLASQLEASKQEARQQQWQVETLTEQLIASQEHISQLEEHCLLLQQDCQSHAERRETAERQLLELRAVLQFVQSGAAQKSTEEFSETPLENPLLYFKSLPAIPVDPQNWSMPILPPLMAT